MTKTVLDVGNCGPDHRSICNMLKANFSDLEIRQTDTLAETLATLRESPCDLVLINRKLDIDYSDGIEIIRQIKADADLQNVPVMLISNYEEHQQTAVEAGALLGFGKLELNTSGTRQKLSAVLQAD